MMTEYINRFWLRAIKVSTEAAQRRFLESFSIYVYAVSDEASDRNGGHVRGIKDFLEVRRGTVAAYASYFCVELGMDIPDEIMTHPAIGSLLGLVADSTLLTNVRIDRPWP
jgi:hypothetical protein